ncbi:MAG TPA: transcription termination/antitermination NusG family protein [Candidatus Solibacter sp.]|nr:transcription termination/antitermination NusG family protein [Candidatus Solibacter sp.]
MAISLGTEIERWFAVQVRRRWESSTALLLSGKGYQTLLPTYKERKRWNGRLREVNAPLFPGYVFCQFDTQRRLPILVTPGVIAVVSQGKVPLPVDDAEIAAIRTLVSSGVPVEPWPFLEIGQKVRIESDALLGLEGILVQFKGNHRVVLSVSLLRRSVALEIDRASVRPLGRVRVAALDAIGPHRLLSEVVA